MLALIKNNTVLNRLEIIGQFIEGGWADLPDGSRVAPASDGWELRGYELRTIAAAAPVPEGFYVTSTAVEIVGSGPQYVNVLAAVVEPVPEEISRRQFFQVLALSGRITYDEALAAVTSGALPAAIDYLIERIEDDDIRWSVRMSFAALTFYRSNWCVEMFAAMQEMTAEETDQIWRNGALLD